MYAKVCQRFPAIHEKPGCVVKMPPPPTRAKVKLSLLIQTISMTDISAVSPIADNRNAFFCRHRPSKTVMQTAYRAGFSVNHGNWRSPYPVPIAIFNNFFFLLDE